MTEFTVTINAKTDKAQAFTISLGQDILDGVHEDTILTLASQSRVITVQGELRKLDTADAMEKHLVKKYPNAYVNEGVVKAASNTAVLNAILKKFDGNKDEAMAKLEQFLEMQG